jgi:hypothetical protein
LREYDQCSSQCGNVVADEKAQKIAVEGV